MKFNELTAPRQKKTNRVGRGISAGQGKTAGRGTKGQGARKSSTKAGFEGGQMPIHMRIPKLRGFKSKRAVVETVYTSDLETVKSAVADNKALFDAKLVSSAYTEVKLVVNGELKSKKTVKLQGASKEAVKAVQAAGGTFERVAQPARQSKKSEK